MFLLTELDRDGLVHVTIIDYFEGLAQVAATCETSKVQHVRFHLDNDLRTGFWLSTFERIAGFQASTGFRGVFLNIFFVINKLFFEFKFWGFRDNLNIRLSRGGFLDNLLLNVNELLTEDSDAVDDLTVSHPGWPIRNVIAIGPRNIETKNLDIECRSSLACFSHACILV